MSSRLGVIVVAVALSACSHLASQSGGEAVHGGAAHQGANGTGQSTPGQSADSTSGTQQSLASRSDLPGQGADGTAAGGQGGAGASDDQSQGGAADAADGGGTKHGTRLGKRSKRGMKGDSTAGGGGAAGEDSDEASDEGGTAAGGEGATGSDGATGSNSAAGTNGATSAGADGMNPESDTRLADVSSPSNGVAVDEDREPQTLGGTLPLVVGVNEEGRFDFDEYALRPEVKHILDDLAGKLSTAEYDRLDIAGYTDRIGAVDYNQRLSELRAYAVSRYLIEKGVPENKIHYVGRGVQNPLTAPGECSDLDREQLITCLQKDRRVEIEASIHRKRATVLR